MLAEALKILYQNFWLAKSAYSKIMKFFASFKEIFWEEYIPVLVWRRRSDRPVSAESLHALQSVSGAAQWVSVQHWLLTRLACADSARLRHMNQPALTTAPLLSSLALIKLSNSRKMTSFSLCVYSSLHSTIVQFERRKQQKSGTK